MKILRDIIKIDDELCNGCGQCVPGCAEGALTIIDGKARLIAEKYCDGLGACLGECPTGALRLVKQEADDFDEAAVEALLAAQQTEIARAKTEIGRVKVDQAATMDCGCASSHIQSFTSTIAPCQAAGQPRRITIGATDQINTSASCPAQSLAPSKNRAKGDSFVLPLASSDPPASQDSSQNQPTPFSLSALTHWPIQIRLVPPEAPFLRGADLLIAADCVPVAHPNFNHELLPGKVVLLGCPKFDDAQAYVAKLGEIFRVEAIKSVTIAIMEVPCCGSMRGIVRAALQQSGVDIPTEEVVVGVRGNLTFSR